MREARRQPIGTPIEASPPSRVGRVFDRVRRSATLATAATLLAVPGFAAIMGSKGEPKQPRKQPQPTVVIEVQEHGSHEGLLVRIIDENLKGEKAKVTNVTVYVKKPHVDTWRTEFTERDIDTTGRFATISVEPSEVTGNATYVIVASERFTPAKGAERTITGNRSFMTGEAGEIIWKSLPEEGFPDIPPYTEK